jgi:hypothetical protein
MRAKCYDCKDKRRLKTFNSEWSFMYIAGEIRQLCPKHTLLRQQSFKIRRNKLLSGRRTQRIIGD